MDDFDQESGQEYGMESVRVVVRARPLTKKEIDRGYRNILLMDPEQNLIALNRNDVASTTFKFDQVFGENATQSNFYYTIAAPIVEKALQGYNGTIMAYGQTGTGKTYTMFGKQNQPELRGIIPNAFSHIFHQISRAQDKIFFVSVTFLEIYNEDVRDLLSATPSKKLPVKEFFGSGFYVENLKSFTVNSVESITELLHRGNKNRITRPTLLNEASSRSHAIFTISIRSKDINNNSTTAGKLNLVDLAGSERAKRTKASGQHLREASKTNCSLSVLGRVISALASGNVKHIPYRNSNLTRLLQDSLGGNSETTMIAMISPADIDYEESMCTLRYASRAKKIQNYTKINIEQKNLIAKYDDQIALLQQELELMLQAQNKGKAPRKKVQAPVQKKVQSPVTTPKKPIQVIPEEKPEEIKQYGNGMPSMPTNLSGESEIIKELSVMQNSIAASGRKLLENLQQQILEDELNKQAEQQPDIGDTKVDNSETEQYKLELLLYETDLLSRDTQIIKLMIQNFVQKQYLKKKVGNVVCSTDTQQSQLKIVAYAGNDNNKRKRLCHSAPIRFDTEPGKGTHDRCVTAVPKPI